MGKIIRGALLSLIALSSFFALTSCGKSNNDSKTNQNVSEQSNDDKDITDIEDDEEVETTYTINHYQEKLNNNEYEISSSQSIPGISNHYTEAQAKTIDGFTPKIINQEKIKKDGSTVINIYYDRNRYQISINESNMGTTLGSGEYKHGQTVTVSAEAKSGFEFVGWYSNNAEISKLASYSFVAEANIILEARFKNKKIDYKVYHYKENIDNNEYTLVEADIETLTGNSFGETQAQGKYYIGFDVKTFNQEEINPDGSTIVKIYYERLKRTVFTSNLNPTKGSVTGAGIYKYGQTVTLVASPNTGYTVSGWYISNSLVEDQSKYTFVMGLDNVSVNVDFKPTTVEYLVKHYKQNIDNDEYTLVSADSEVLTGDSFTQTQAEANTYTGFNAKTIEQKTINPDGSTVVNVYYDRIVKTVSVINNNTERGSYTGSGNYKYGQTVTLKASQASGYAIDGWYIDSGLVCDSDEYTFEMGVNDITIELRFKYQNANYTVKHYQENLDDSNYTLVENDTKVLTGTSYSLTQATANTYTGFTANTIEQKTINPDGSTVVEIYYKRRTIQLVLSVLPQGKGSVTGLGTYKYGKSVNIKATPNTGYTFKNWTLSNQIVSTNSSYTALIESTANTITYVANFTLNTHSITINTSGINSSNIVIRKASNNSVVSKDFEYGIKYRLELSYDGDDIVQIIYNNTNTVYDTRVYEFTMPDNDITFNVNVSPIFKVDNKVYYGSYPQTEVTDSTTKSALNNILGSSLPTSSNYNGWTANRLYKDSSQSSYKEYLFFKDVKYNGEKYRAVYFINYKPTAHNTAPSTSTISSYQDDNNYFINTVYWFKFESIKWTILDTDSSGNALIFADLILDAREYFVNQNSGSYSHMVEGYSYGTGYANDYAASTIRNWFNNQFVLSATSSAQRNYYVFSSIDHSAQTLDGTTSNRFPSATTSTTEAFFFLSYSEANQYENISLTTSGTTYSLCMGYNSNYYWLRSPSRYASTEVTTVSSINGSFNSVAVTTTTAGVRPACYVKLPS